VKGTNVVKMKDFVVLEPNNMKRVSSLDPATLLKHEEVNERSLSHDWT